jgi:hypothetical protein
MSAVTLARAAAAPPPRGWRALPLAAALRAALLLLALTSLTATAVRLACADAARRLLGFDFPGVPAEPAVAAHIFLNNARLLAGVLVACVAVQLAQRDDGDGLPRILLRVMAAVCDGALLVGCAMHVLVVGIAFGAYGARTLAATAVHGPVELAGFSLALGLYATARRERLPARTLARTALAAPGTLALAAVLETFA